MKLRATTIILVAMLVSGCLPKSAMLKHRDIQNIEAGLGVDGTKKIIPSDEEVDLLAAEVTELLQQQGFELLNSSVSWGLQPLTGHTQNLGFRFPGTNSVHCYVQISKKEFRAKFRELESKPQTNEFNTNDRDLAAISKAIASLDTLTKQKFNGRSIRVSRFDRAESPNKSKHSEL
ncbi:hypothetical protein N9537_01975 [Porticoccaceae bacterium]|nr:hypothetical protein [Porticoccaceae bacterium]